MSEIKQCGACPGCQNTCRHEAENPPTLGGEPEVLAWVHPHRGLDWRVERTRVAPKTELVDRANITRLQAEVERLNADLVTFKGGISALGEATKKLVLCARTTGGTAGSDQQLIDACSGVEQALSLPGVSKAIDYIEGLEAKYEAARDRKSSIVALQARIAELEGLLRDMIQQHAESGTDYTAVVGRARAALAEGAKS